MRPTLPTSDPSIEHLAGGDRPWGSWAGPRVLPPTSDDASGHFGPELWEKMENDPVLYASVSKLATAAVVGGVHALPAVEPEDGEEPTGDALLARDYADFAGAMLEGLRPGIVGVAREMAVGAFGFGNKLAECVEHAALRDGKRWLRTIQPKPWWSWRLAVGPVGQPESIVPMVATPAVPDAPGALSADGVLYSGRRLDLDRVWILGWDVRDGDVRGRSLYRHVYSPWNAKAQAGPEYFKFLQRFGGPAVQVEVAKKLAAVVPRDDLGNEVPGAPPIPGEIALYLAAKNWRPGGVLLTPEGCKATLHEPQGDGSVYLKGFDFYDRQITQGVLHAARAVMEAKHGSKADGEQAQDTSGDLEKYVADWIAEGLREVVRRVVRANWGDDAADRLCPRIVVGEVARQDKTAQLLADVSAGYSYHHSQFPGLDARHGAPKRADNWREDEIAREDAA